jgi:hypothetical protein
MYLLLLNFKLGYNLKMESSSYMGQSKRYKKKTLRLRKKIEKNINTRHGHL